MFRQESSIRTRKYNNSLPSKPGFVPLHFEHGDESWEYRVHTRRVPTARPERLCCPSRARCIHHLYLAPILAHKLDEV
jgi:hypothetical protein